MKQLWPFWVTPAELFDAEQQVLIAGAGAGRYQVVVPKGGNLDQLTFSGGEVFRERITLNGDRIVTSYRILGTENGYFYLMNGVANFYGKDNLLLRENWMGLDSRFEGPAVRVGSDSIVGIYSKYQKKGMDFEYVQYAIDSRGTIKSLCSFPSEVGGAVVQHSLVDGGILRTWQRSKPVDSAHFFVTSFDGKVVDHPIAQALNQLVARGISLSGGSGQIIGNNEVQFSRTKSHWGVFHSDEIPGLKEWQAFLFSAVDSVWIFPLKLQDGGPQVQPRISDLLVSPNQNWFLAIGQWSGTQSVLYFCKVGVRESKHFVDCYRFGAFENIRHLVLGAEGESILFVAKVEGIDQFVYARLDDILSDINRRYPEAKLSLAALESEVK